MKKLSLITLFVLMLGFNPVPSSGFVPEFSFQLTTGDTVKLSDYSGKPLLLEWGASWCSTCKANQAAMSKIYADYSDRVTFISISFGGSGDTLGDVKQMKEERGYEWDFALDTENYAKTVRVANGYTWLLDGDLNLVKTWNYTIVTASQLAQAFENAFGYSNSVGSEELLVPFPTFAPLLALAVIPLIRRGRR